MPAIVVESVSKMYRLARSGDERLPYRTLRDDLVRWASWPFRAFHGRTGHARDFWALKDVSFEVQPGEVVGVIGRNGAGKSTLLKVLSRITRPTAGRVRLRGRVGSLLEVGTGFHPELTGRENIYLSGAVLGMKRAEIRRKFDEIVAFAEVEKFLDLPAKRYSSGMYMRLAFAVAAHLEPEILLVDEVLAVGDAAFQKKCLGKMGEVAQGGRTVIFVSHNMAATVRLCKQVAWLHAGQLLRIGPAEPVVAEYLRDDANTTGVREWPDGTAAPGTDRIRLRRVRLLGPAGHHTDRFDARLPIDIELTVEVLRPIPNVRLSFRLLSMDGTTVFTSTDHRFGAANGGTVGEYVATCRIPGGLLNVGDYSVSPGADLPFTEVLFFAESALGFTVEDPGGATTPDRERLPGVVRPLLEWSFATAV